MAIQIHSNIERKVSITTSSAMILDRVGSKEKTVTFFSRGYLHENTFFINLWEKENPDGTRTLERLGLVFDSDQKKKEFFEGQLLTEGNWKLRLIPT